MGPEVKERTGPPLEMPAEASEEALHRLSPRLLVVLLHWLLLALLALALPPCWW